MLASALSGDVAPHLTAKVKVITNNNPLFDWIVFNVGFITLSLYFLYYLTVEAFAAVRRVASLSLPLYSLKQFQFADYLRTCININELYW